MAGWVADSFRGPAGAFGVALVLAALAGSPAAARTSSAIVVDAASGRVLYESNADARAYPASLAKMMTLYLLFEALDSKRLTLESPLTVSRHAAGMDETNINLRPGDRLTVEQAIRAIIVRSANDAAATVAEALAGSERGFAEMMTGKARRLGMKETHFRNASGLPDAQQRTTARDLAILARALVGTFPDYYRYFGERKFSFRGHTYVSHNHLMKTYKGADGLKTGYIRASGFNLVASASREGRRLIAVVLGGTSPGARDAQVARLLDRGFGLARKLPEVQQASLALPEPPPVSAVGERGIPPTKPLLAVAQLRPVPEAKPGTLVAAAPAPAPPVETATASPPEIELRSIFASEATAAEPPATVTYEPSIAPVVAMKPPAIEVAPASGLPTPPSPIEALVAAVVADGAALPPVKPALPASEGGPAVPPTKPSAVETASIQPGSELVVASGRWTIQVGAYSRFVPAHAAANEAMAKLPKLLDGGRVVIEERPGENGKLYRARVAGLTEPVARAACRQLAKQANGCLVVAPNTSMASSSH